MPSNGSGRGAGLRFDPAKCQDHKAEIEAALAGVGGKLRDRLGPNGAALKDLLVALQNELDHGREWDVHTLPDADIAVKAGLADGNILP